MPRRRRSFDAVVRAAASALRARRVDHVFVGAIAVIAFGQIRTTSDVDVIARFPLDEAPALAKEFRRRGFVVTEDDLRNAFLDRTQATIEDTRSTYRIDLTPAIDPAAEHALKERRWVTWPGRSIPLARPEHTIGMKVRFGSEQ